MPITSSLAASCGYGRMYTLSGSHPPSDSVRVVFLSATGVELRDSDVRTKINAAVALLYPSVSVTITTITDRTTNGSTVTTANYDVAFVVTSQSFSNSALGTALNNFVAAGGGLVMTAFAMTTVPIPGFSYANYAPVLSGGSNNRTGSSTLGTFTASDPLMSNVSTFNNGTSGFGATTLTLASGATVVASFTDGGQLVVKRVIGTARTVVLNFYAPSSDARSDFWTASTDGGRLMANAILWAGKAVS